MLLSKLRSISEDYGTCLRQEARTCYPCDVVQPPNRRQRVHSTCAAQVKFAVARISAGYAPTSTGTALV